MKLLCKRHARLICIATAMLVTIESAGFTASYYAAMRFLSEHDPRKSGNASGVMVFARPRLVRRGQIISKAALCEHLSRIGYQEREGEDAGTFHDERDVLRINARLAEFQSATVTFKAGRVERIEVEGREVEQIEIEPQVLTSFVKSVRDEVAVRMRVRRIILQASDIIPSALYDAVRASEDRLFESHNGIDEAGMLKGLLAGRGGSTITQQMIKNAVLADQSRTLDRKSKEMMLALAAERMFTKSEIFTAYANNCYLGHVAGGPTIYGFAAAALELFGTANVRDLSLAQAAALAGLLNQPESYLKAARAGEYRSVIARRDRVLDLMGRNFPDRYPAEGIERAKAESLKFLFASESEQEQPLDMISKPFQKFAADRAAGPGSSNHNSNLHIYTTLDEELQEAAHKAVAAHLGRLDTRVEKIQRRKLREGDERERLQAALVALDARSGEILAMVGGRDGEFNRATARRSPGSAIKPFVYLKAIEKGWHDGPFTPATIINPARDRVDNYRPQRHMGGPGRARAFLARSDNGAAVVAAHDAGLGEVRDFYHELTGSLPVELSGMLAIGGSAGCEVSLLSLASAYTIFPNNGVKVEATPFAAIYRDGVKVDAPRDRPSRKIDAAPAYVVTEMLRSVMGQGPDGGHGTARGALKMAGLDGGCEVAGKTGTGEVSDFWFVGFTPRVVVAVWVGMDNNFRLTMNEGFDGARAALPIWAEFMRAVVKYRADLLEGRFAPSPDVRVLKIDSERGCLTEGAGANEFFIRGREPQPCQKKDAVKVD